MANCSIDFESDSDSDSLFFFSTQQQTIARKMCAGGSIEIVMRGF